MKQLPLQLPILPAAASGRVCSTLAVMNWAQPSKPTDRALKPAALPYLAAPRTDCSAMLSAGELDIHRPLIRGMR